MFIHSPLRTDSAKTCGDWWWSWWIDAVAPVQRQRASLESRTTPLTNTLEHFARTGDVKTSHGGGAHHIYDEERMQQLRQLLSRQPGMNSGTLLSEMGSSAPPISERTLRRYRAELDLTRRHRRITTAPNPKHDMLRHAWAWEHRRAPVRRWVHSDESTMCVMDTGDFVWIRRGQPTPRLPVQQLRFSVNVWGAVWDEGKVFVQFEGHLDSPAFIAILEDYLIPQKENVAGRPLLLDRLPAHHTAKVRHCLAEHSIPFVLLPPHSPQFNAIEECWSWIKRWVRGCAPNSPWQLREYMEAACDALPQSVIRANLDHAQNSIRDCAYKDLIP